MLKHRYRSLTLHETVVLGGRTALNFRDSLSVSITDDINTSSESVGFVIRQSSVAQALFRLELAVALTVPEHILVHDGPSSHGRANEMCGRCDW